MKNIIHSQLRSLTQILIKNGLLISYNFPTLKGSDLIWENYKNLTFSLQDEDYDLVYDKVMRSKDYNFLMIDGAFVQLQYSFNRNSIKSHILRYYPSPNNESYKGNEELFQSAYYGNEPFSDMIDKKIVPFPVRFDFDDDAKKFVEYDHSMSHCTMGNITSFRLPVCKPVTPNRFVDFILRNFYMTMFKEKFTNYTFSCPISIIDTITPDERSIIHINFV